MPWLDVAEYAAVGGLLVRRGRQSINPNPFTVGVTKPNALNVGLPPLRPLTTVLGDITVTSAGTLLEGLDIYGRILARAAGLTVRNCRVRGANNVTGNTGLIDCNHPSAANVLVESCDLRPDFPTYWLTGIIGHDYTIRYSHIWNVVDGCGAYNRYAPTALANVLIEANYIHDLAYYSPDPNQKDNNSHNDGIQIQGNGGVVIRGNTILANVSTTAGAGSSQDIPRPNPWFPSVTGQAIGITPNVSKVQDTLIEKNWIDYGAQSITIASGNVGDPTTTALVRLNRFGRNQPNLTKGGTTARRAILMTSDLTNPQGLPSSTGLDTNNGNVFEDNGQPVTVYRLAAA